MKTKKVFLTLAVGMFLLQAHGLAATYEVDASHTTVGFKIKHLISYTTGRFTKFAGTVDFEPGKPETWSAQGTIETASIDTANADRDKHLRNADFFDVDNNPTISFKTTKVVEATETHAKVEGLLTMKGVEKPIVLDVEILGTIKDPWGNERCAFSATTTINRKDFGISFNKTLDTGGLMLGEEVMLNLEVEAIAKK